MNIRLNARTLVLAFAAMWSTFSFTGCAAVNPYEESVVVDAGFHQVIPETVSERNAYNALPPYQVQRTDAPGHTVYAYHNKSKDVTYIGGEAEYKRYQQLIQQRGKERSDQLTAQMNQDALHMMH
jgi:hypothetical protein